MKLCHPVRPERREAGASIVVAMMTLMVVAGLIAAAASYTRGIAMNVRRTQVVNGARSIADGCLEQAFSSWRQVCRRHVWSPPTSFELTSIATPVIGDFPIAASKTDLTISNFSVKAVSPTWQPIPEGQVPGGVLGENPGIVSFFYKATVDIGMPSLTGKTSTRLTRIFEKENISPWAFAIFYNDLCEIHPGPSFIVSGAVHTNQSLYSAHSTLEFEGKVTYVGSWELAYAPGDTNHGGAPGKPTWPSNLPPARDTTLQLFGLDPSTTWSTTDANPNNDGYREYIEKPVSGQTDPVSTERFYNQAAVRVEVNASNAVTISKGDGTVISASSTGANLALYNAVRNAVTTGDNIQDNREAAQVRLVTLDIAQITAATVSGAIPSSFNGVLYIFDSSGTSSSSSRRGVRLKNGGKLPANGLTVVSANPIYVQGDYNTGTNTNGTNQPASNSGDATLPEAVGYTRKPAALIGDAVTILSNAWTDASSFQSLTNRKATNTTVNAAIMSGIIPTQGSANGYSGGVENFPRFLEDWGSRTLTYYGSMVEMYKSQQSIGSWGNSNTYAAPTRRWFFDTKFYTQPPPGSFVITRYVRHLWQIE